MREQVGVYRPRGEDEAVELRQWAVEQAVYLHSERSYETAATYSRARTEPQPFGPDEMTQAVIATAHRLVEYVRTGSGG